jgi:hypothetical protein
MFTTKSITAAEYKALQVAHVSNNVGGSVGELVALMLVAPLSTALQRVVSSALGKESFIIDFFTAVRLLAIVLSEHESLVNLCPCDSIWDHSPFFLPRPSFLL